MTDKTLAICFSPIFQPTDKEAVYDVCFTCEIKQNQPGVVNDPKPTSIQNPQPANPHDSSFVCLLLSQFSKAVEFNAALAYMISHASELFAHSKTRKRSVKFSIEDKHEIAAQGSTSTLPSSEPSPDSSDNPISAEAITPDSIQAPQDGAMRRSGIIHLATLVTTQYDDKDVQFFARADYDFVPEFQFESMSMYLA